MRKHGKFREKGTNFVTGNLEEHNSCSRRDTDALFGKTEEGRPWYLIIDFEFNKPEATIALLV